MNFQNLSTANTPLILKDSIVINPCCSPWEDSPISIPNLLTIEKNASDLSINKIHVETYDIDTRNFYLKHGFYVLSTISNFYLNQNKYIMCKFLDFEKNKVISHNKNIQIEHLSFSHLSGYIEGSKASLTLHKGFISVPTDETDFLNLLAQSDWTRNYKFVIKESMSQQLVGLINLNDYVKGAFNSAYLGYYAFSPLARKGYMSAAMRLILDYAKLNLNLHRVEANIQPNNLPSIQFIKQFNFIKEGYSPLYLKMGDVYRDHERWALIL